MSHACWRAESGAAPYVLAGASTLSATRRPAANQLNQMAVSLEVVCKLHQPCTLCSLSFKRPTGQTFPPPYSWLESADGLGGEASHSNLLLLCAVNEVVAIDQLKAKNPSNANSSEAMYCIEHVSPREPGRRPRSACVLQGHTCRNTTSPNTLAARLCN